MIGKTRKTAAAKWGALVVAGCTAAATVTGVTGCAPKTVPLTSQQQAEIMRADPDMQAVLDQLHRDGGKSFSMLTVEQARSGPSAGTAAAEVAKAQGLTVPEPVGGVAQTNMTGRDGNNITLQVYTPTGTGTFPVLVYYHGGGFVVGSVLSGNPYDGSCRALCNKAHCVVVEVDYRLAPENKFPAAVNDSFDALEYVISHADRFHGNGRVAVAGESAGGNLAVAVSLMARDQHAPLPTSILAVYPVGGYYADTPAAQENATAIPLDTPSLRWFYDRYLGSAADRTSPYFDVVKADLHGLPPTTVITAQIDPLRDDGRMLVDNLRAAGVTVRSMNYDGVTHEFFGMGMVVAKAKDAQTFAVTGLISGFGMMGM